MRLAQAFASRAERVALGGSIGCACEWITARTMSIHTHRLLVQLDDREGAQSVRRGRTTGGEEVRRTIAPSAEASICSICSAFTPRVSLHAGSPFKRQGDLHTHTHRRDGQRSSREGNRKRSQKRNEHEIEEQDRNDITFLC